MLVSPFESKRFRDGVLCDRFIGNLIQSAAGLALKYANVWSNFSIVSDILTFGRRAPLSRKRNEPN
jgi:hypothetical protein